MEEVRTHVLETDRGEILVEDGGRLDGLAVVVHPGSPGSRLLYGAGTQLAARCGLRVLSFDRPGYGSRPAQPGRTIADCSDPEGWLERWGGMAEQDQAHSREVAEYLAADVRESLGNGDQGWWDDWAALLEPWGCDLPAIHVPVRLWQ